MVKGDGVAAAYWRETRDTNNSVVRKFTVTRPLATIVNVRVMSKRILTKCAVSYFYKFHLDWTLQVWSMKIFHTLTFFLFHNGREFLDQRRKYSYRVLSWFYCHNFFFCHLVSLRSVLFGKDGVVGKATRYRLEGRGSNLGGRELYRTCPGRPWGSCSLL
jgi:hypothetical protein